MGTSAVVFCLASFIVYAAVNFYDEPSCQAYKIDDKVTDGVLAPELRTQFMASQFLPKLGFRWRWALPISAGVFFQ